MKNQKLGVCFSICNQGLLKEKDQNRRLKSFPSISKFGDVVTGEQISATQTCHRRGLAVEPPAAGGYGSLGAKHPASGRFFVSFWKKMAIHISNVFGAI